MLDVVGVQETRWVKRGTEPIYHNVFFCRTRRVSTVGQVFFTGGNDIRACKGTFCKWWDSTCNITRTFVCCCCL
jgi:hypothetical protein